MTSETSALARDAHPTDRPRPTRAFTRRGHQAVEGRDGRFQVPADHAALAGLLVATALLYLWGLGASGWANSFYSAAAQAGSASWKAFFFGSSDAANSITVDKTPLAIWPMALSVRIFGLSSWSILVPQALEGVGAVWLLHATVRRTTGSAVAALIAGAVLALTPVAVLMFRFNNPDAMLCLLLVAAAYATLRAVESSHAGRRAGRWLVFAGVLVGLAFLAKMLQAFLVLPALILVYAVFAGVAWRRRILHLLAAFAGMLVATGWWIAIVMVWPAASRPYIGGSQHNSILELTLGYNGLGRLDGSETGSVGGGGFGGSGQWGATGLLRMFGSEVGTQVAWLLPAASALGIAALCFARGRRAVQAALTLWLGWLGVTALTFSLMAGIFHPYYTVALAPAIGALVGIGAWVLWQHRTSLVASGVLGFTIAMTTALAFELLARDGSWHPWLKYVVATVGFAAALMIVGVRHLPRRIATTVAVVALLSGLAAPAAYSLSTATTPHSGSIPSAGPASSGGFGIGGGQPPTAGTGNNPGTGASTGGLLDGSTSSTALTELLEADASSYTWVAAAIGSNSAAGYELATQQPVMAVGGFNGSDPSPTLAQFQAWVGTGKIHYFIAGGGGLGGGFGGGPGGGTGGSGTASQITQWVESTFTAKTVDGVTVYDLTTAG
ncbi:glycosyltransferase family 39 protein [Nocardioides sp.]|jgi:4-amino-4-deoxy-L-arabinose transferase-like glycosyltransferase|uniref:glycosyltransferase family 39 protein n=1 Tax=Nocardioides sp. TaxID=35761 RepID=UPI002F4002B0